MIFIHSLDGAWSLIYQIEDWKILITSALTLSVIVLQINKGRSSNESDEDHSRDLVASGMKSQIATNWTTFIFQSSRRVQVLLKLQKAFL